MDFSRRVFMGASAAFLAASGVTGAETAKPKIQGLDETKSGADESLDWIPYADRKVRVGIAGEGVCSFGSAFGFQSHPYVEVVACTDLDPAKCKLLQERVKAQKTYPSCEEMIKHAAEDKLEAVYLRRTRRAMCRSPSWPSNTAFTWRAPCRHSSARSSSNTSRVSLTL